MARHKTIVWALGLSLVAAASGSALAAGDPTKGQAVFSACGSCHTIEPGQNATGPSLHGVVGRPAGSAPNYRYSKAMLAFGAEGGVWDAARLDAFVAKPRSVVKGTKMPFKGIKSPEQRADLIAFLSQVSQ